jgi:hypothetical protein
MLSGAVRVVYVRRPWQLTGAILFPGKHSPVTVTRPMGLLEISANGTSVSHWVVPIQ